MDHIRLPSIFFLPPQNISILNLTPIQYSRQPIYRCDICSKKFIRNSSLIRHFKKHTGEKPYECKVCCKSFSRKDTFNKHKQTRKCVIRSQYSDITGIYENYKQDNDLELAKSGVENTTTN